jgi:hypothetical protein
MQKHAHPAGRTNGPNHSAVVVFRSGLRRHGLGTRRAQVAVPALYNTDIPTFTWQMVHFAVRIFAITVRVGHELRNLFLPSSVLAGPAPELSHNRVREAVKAFRVLELRRMSSPSVKYNSASSKRIDRCTSFFIEAPS